MVPTTAGGKYELMVIFPPTLTEKEIEKELGSIKTLIKKTGDVFHEQIWGKRDLYYKMKKLDKGLYAVIHFTTKEPTTSLSQELKLMSHVVRFLLIKLPHHFELKPFAMLEEEKKEEKKEPLKKEKVVKTKKIVEEEGKSKERKKEQPKIVEPPEKDKEESPKKKKSSFDEKIDEIIENLDNL